MVHDEGPMNEYWSIFPMRLLLAAQPAVSQARQDADGIDIVEMLK